MSQLVAVLDDLHVTAGWIQMILNIDSCSALMIKGGTF
jgi:hypothetical protein